jgi:Spy/CpxP family protein refolding chaperone
MKTIPRVIALSVVLTTAIFAQRGFRPRDAGAPPDPATMAQHQVARLTTLLSLSSDQAAQATTIFTNSATAIAPIQAQMAPARESLQTAVKGNVTATIDQLAAEIGTLSGQTTAIQSKAEAAFYAILTSDQQAKFDQLGGMMMGPGPGGFGRGRGGPPRGNQ